VAASDDGVRDGGADVERYERLRACVLSGGPDGQRLGRALLERRGLAAWAHAWHETAPAPAAAPARAAPGTPAACGEVVAVLAAMALAVCGGR
jgi:hypothetical protein